MRDMREKKQLRKGCLRAICSCYVTLQESLFGMFGSAINLSQALSDAFAHSIVATCVLEPTSFNHGFLW